MTGKIESKSDITPEQRIVVEKLSNISYIEARILAHEKVDPPDQETMWKMQGRLEAYKDCLDKIKG
jgi:hypothetical protein